MGNVLPPSTDSHTSISQGAPKFMLGSDDLHSTLIFCPGWRTCPTLGEISVAEYVPPALAVLASCGAALSAIAKMVASNTRIFILFFLRLIKKTCEHERDGQPIYNYFFVICGDAEMGAALILFRESRAASGVALDDGFSSELSGKKILEANFTRPRRALLIHILTAAPRPAMMDYNIVIFPAIMPVRAHPRAPCAVGNSGPDKTAYCR